MCVRGLVAGRGSGALTCLPLKGPSQCVNRWSEPQRPSHVIGHGLHRTAHARLATTTATPTQVGALILGARPCAGQARPDPARGARITAFRCSAAAGIRRAGSAKAASNTV